MCDRVCSWLKDLFMCVLDGISVGSNRLDAFEPTFFSNHGTSKGLL